MATPHLFTVFKQSRQFSQRLLSSFLSSFQTASHTTLYNLHNGPCVSKYVQSISVLAVQSAKLSVAFATRMSSVHPSIPSVCDTRESHLNCFIIIKIIIIISSSSSGITTTTTTTTSLMATLPSYSVSDNLFDSSSFHRFLCLCMFCIVLSYCICVVLL